LLARKNKIDIPTSTMLFSERENKIVILISDVAKPGIAFQQKRKQKIVSFLF